MRGHPSFEMSSLQKSYIIWSLGHNPCQYYRASVSKSRKTVLGTVDSQLQEFDKAG